jgi:hypothetical protein
MLPSLPMPSVDAEQLVHQLEDLLRRDEADIVLIAGNFVLVALEIIEWPVAALALAVHLLARSRFKAVETLAEVGQEAE